MSTFEVLIDRISEVMDHPNADRLSLNKIRGYIAISAKHEDGSHRYSPGDLVIYVPEGALVPEYLLREGFWDEKKNKGIVIKPFRETVDQELGRVILKSVSEDYLTRKNATEFN